MTKLLEQAIEIVSTLPEADQDRIAKELIYYVDKLMALRADVEVGIRQLDAGEGRELDINEFLREAREKHRKQNSPG